MQFMYIEKKQSKLQ